MSSMSSMSSPFSFDVLQCLSLNGQIGSPNDDRVGAHPLRGWVVDGATDLGEPGLLGDQGGAAWLATQASLGFARTEAADVRTVCADMFAHVASRFDAERRRDVTAPWELPKAAFAVVQLVGDRLDIAWGADCPVLLWSGGTATWCTGAPDTSVEAADAAALGIGQGGAPHITGAVLADRRAQRMQADHAALSPDPDASARITRYNSLPVVAGDEVLVMSDGFSALVSDYRRYTGETLMAAVRQRGLAALVEEIREIERGDASCARYPRFKVSDDATALWLRVSG